MRGKQPECEQRADDRARVVHRAVEPECPPALLGSRRRCDQRVARCRAYALSDPIEEPEQQDGHPARRHPDQRSHRVRERVAAEDQRLRGHAAVGEATGDEFQDAGGRLGQPLHETDDRGPGAQRGREEDRQQRRDHLARCVVQKRDEAEDDDRARERNASRTVGDRVHDCHGPPGSITCRAHYSRIDTTGRCGRISSPPRRARERAGHGFSTGRRDRVALLASPECTSSFPGSSRGGWVWPSPPGRWHAPCLVGASWASCRARASRPSSPAGCNSAILVATCAPRSMRFLCAKWPNGSGIDISSRAASRRRDRSSRRRFPRSRCRPR